MRSRGVYSTQMTVDVPFFDVDLMQVVWHGHYVKYLEQARAKLLGELGHGYGDIVSSEYVWPVIDLQLRYMQPALLGQSLTVRADLVEWENRLKIHYLITDTATGTRLTRASTVQVAVHVPTREMQLVSPQPMRDSITRKLTELGALK